MCTGKCWMPVGISKVIIITLNTKLIPLQQTILIHVLLCSLPPLQLLSVTLPLTPLHPIFPTFPPPLSSPPCMWRSVFGDPQLAYWVQVKLNYGGMFPCSMAGPVGLSMGALPLHWQPGDFHFEGRGGGEELLPDNFYHIIPTVSAVFIGTVEPWAKAAGLMMCTCEAHLKISAQALLRRSASVTAGHPAQLRVLWMHSSPFACSTFIFPHKQHVGTLKRVSQSSLRLLWTCFFCKYIAWKNNCSVKDFDILPGCTFMIQRARTHCIQAEVSCFVFHWMLTS